MLLHPAFTNKCLLKFTIIFCQNVRWWIVMSSTNKTFRYFNVLLSRWKYMRIRLSFEKFLLTPNWAFSSLFSYFFQKLELFLERTFFMFFLEIKYMWICKDAFWPSASFGQSSCMSACLLCSSNPFGLDLESLQPAVFILNYSFRVWLVLSLILSHQYFRFDSCLRFLCKHWPIFLVDQLFHDYCPHPIFHALARPGGC